MDIELNLKEKTSFDLTITFRDPRQDGELHSAVDKVTWWVTEPRRALITHQATEIVTPTNPLTILVPASANICAGKKDEKRMVVVKAESGDNIAHSYYSYTVTAIPTVPMSAV